MNATQLKVRLSDHGANLLVFLAAHLQLSNHKAKALLDARRVFVNGQRIWMARHRLDPGDCVEIQEADSPSGFTHRPVVSREAVLYESSDYLIANKPAGILANGPKSLEFGLRRLLGKPALTAVHRLDRDTSGCLLFAQNAEAETRIRPLFVQHRLRKMYHAIVSGFVPDPEQEITHPIDHRNARTLVRTLDANKRASHLWIELETGRTHQIRRHLVAIGHPLIGDQQYATRREVSPQERTIRRQMLHAYELAFRHPVTGKPVHAKAPLPDDFTACLRKFGLT
ncbi:MAG: RluA family pseudouridine synthase [Verrucomicrobia bacterium]|nr:RluA family pseudouridine synthase [Verrucomicrobiota bacterium]MBU1735384.1 RluA family pseudouridine synthase [Verrucomicrobiota bacterium]MBU1857461.1 RluA family pseudouridine synthase [Verrucomicrobiota bacterium]